MPQGAPEMNTSCRPRGGKASQNRGIDHQKLPGFIFMPSPNLRPDRAQGDQHQIFRAAKSGQHPDGHLGIIGRINCGMHRADRPSVSWPGDRPRHRYYTWISDGSRGNPLPHIKHIARGGALNAPQFKAGSTSAIKFVIATGDYGVLPSADRTGRQARHIVKGKNHD